MPASSPAQAFAARQAMDVKTGQESPKDVTRGAVTMSKMPMDKLKHFMGMKECMTEEQKKRLLVILRRLREEYSNTGNVGGETDITNPDNLQVNEDEFTAREIPHKNVVAKTFETEADFDSYVNQRRGIEITPREQQAITTYKQAKPTQQDRFFIKFENTDEFGNNDTTVIKKLREGDQFCWTAFSRHETAKEEGKPEGSEDKEDRGREGGGEERGEELPELQEQNLQPREKDLTINDPIRITKSITFIDETEGANTLADFLIALDI